MMIRLSIAVCLLCCLLGPASSFMATLNERTRKPTLLGITKTISAPPLLLVDSDSPPPNANRLEVVYTTESETVEDWLKEYAAPSAMLGFDTESIPNAPWLKYARETSDQEGPATLQLSTLDSCLILHLTHCSLQLTPLLQDVLQDTSILKLGVGLDEDALGLYRSARRLELNGRLDLSCLLEGSSPQKRMGLRPLLAETTRLNLPKSKKLTMSNWGAAPPLTQPQLTYAAHDAWASVQIVHALEDQLDLTNLQQQLEQTERSLEEMDLRAQTRKTAKTQWNQLKRTKANWTEGDRIEQDRLWQIMSDMRPDPPLTLNISTTGN